MFVAIDNTSGLICSSELWWRINYDSDRIESEKREIHRGSWADWKADRTCLPDVLFCLVRSLQVAQHQLLRSQGAFPHGLLHLVDGGFFQGEAPTWGHWKEPRGVSISL